MERNRNHLELAVFGQFIAHFASGLRSQGQVVRGVTEQEVLGSFTGHSKRYLSPQIWGGRKLRTCRSKIVLSRRCQAEITLQ